MHIEVSASDKYDKSTGFESISVNKGPVHLETEFGPIDVAVHIKGYKLNGQPVTSEYFDRRAKENFSIQFTWKPSKDINGDQLLWGNDFDTPIRDLLPWGFSAAFATFKRLVDPSVDGDVYADKPYLYGPALSSINYLQEQGDQSTPGIVEEPGASARQKKYLDKAKRQEYVFKKGETYAFDFCTPYLELSTQLAVKLPGFTFDVGKYADKTELRYVLRAGDELVFRVSLNVVDNDQESLNTGDAAGDQQAAGWDKESRASTGETNSATNTVKEYSVSNDIDEVD